MEAAPHRAVEVVEVVPPVLFNKVAASSVALRAVEVVPSVLFNKVAASSADHRAVEVVPPVPFNQAAALSAGHRELEMPDLEMLEIIIVINRSSMRSETWIPTMTGGWTQAKSRRHDARSSK